mgnify:FL=1
MCKLPIVFSGNYSNTVQVRLKHDPVLRPAGVLMSSDLLEQIDRHLASANLSWLFGAGISFDAAIPLMGPLTDRVCAILESDKCPQNELLKVLIGELPKGANVEQVLSHLGDYLTLAERSASKKVKIGKKQVQCDDLRSLHSAIVEAIAHTIR